MYERRPLSVLVDRHIGGGTPSRSNPQYWNGKIPWASVKDFVEGALLLEETEESISIAGLQASSSNLIPENTPLVCTRMAVGRTAIAPVPVAINQDVKALFPTTNTKTRYLLRVMDSLQHSAEARAVGSTVKGIRIADYLDLKTPVAPFQAQPKIIEILDTLDTQIRRTEALIAKLELAKQGLLTDLLTRGVDGDGNLRAPADQAPDIYKDSPLGKIPKEWEVAKINAEVRIEHGYAFPGDLFTNQPIGPVLLVPGNFHRNGGLYFTDRNTKYFNGDFPEETVLENGDLLIVMTDLSPMTLILGRTVVLNQSFPVLHNQRIGKMVFCDPKRWVSHYFSLAMNEGRVRSKIIAEATGTTVRHTSPSRIGDCQLLRPQPVEQDLIYKSVNKLEERITTETNSLTKLHSYKIGLMDDLLTGRVRVTPLLDDVAGQAAQ